MRESNSLVTIKFSNGMVWKGRTSYCAIDTRKGRVFSFNFDICSKDEIVGFSQRLLRKFGKRPVWPQIITEAHRHCIVTIYDDIDVVRLYGEAYFYSFSFLDDDCDLWEASLVNGSRVWRW